MEQILQAKCATSLFLCGAETLLVRQSNKIMKELTCFKVGRQHMHQNLHPFKVHSTTGAVEKKQCFDRFCNCLEWHQQAMSSNVSMLPSNLI